MIQKANTVSARYPTPNSCNAFKAQKARYGTPSMLKAKKVDFRPITAILRGIVGFLFNRSSNVTVFFGAFLLFIFFFFSIL